MFNIIKAMFYKDKDRDKYKGYSDDLKKYCQYQDKYRKYWHEQAINTEQINKYYSLFINNNLNMDYFNLLIKYCNKYIELDPIIEESKKEDTIINGTEYPIIKSNLAYKKLALAYEKLGNYQKAILICEEAIKNGYTDDDTKSGYLGRIEKLNKKMENYTTAFK